MNMFETFENWALHAFADGELQGEEKLSIEKLLAENEEARKALANINYQKSELRKAYDNVLDQPVPAALIAAANRKSAPRLLPYLIAACAAMLFIAGGAVGWFANQQQIEKLVAETLPARALNSYVVYGPEMKHAVEVSGGEAGHLDAWLSKRIGVKFAIPDLTAKGYTLVGGRLLAEGDKPAGLLMYEDANKQRLAIYIAANDKHTNGAMKIEHRGNLVSCYWVEPDLVYALAGEQPTEEMLDLAQAAHEGFDKEA
jgi:anti-sigma factor RsiW